MENKKNKTDKNLTWSFKGMYSSPKDPRIEKDMKNYEALCDSFEKKHKKNVHKINQPKVLKSMMEDFIKTAFSRTPDYYLFLQKATNSKDQFIQALDQKISSRMKIAGNKISFFKNAVSKIKKSDQSKILNSKELSTYKQFLSRLFEVGKFELSDAEEKIFNLLSTTSYNMWVDGGTKTRSLEEVSFDGKMIPLSEARNILSNLPRNKRKILYGEILKAFKRNADYTEKELNAVYTFKKINDEIRGHKKPYEDILISHDISEEVLSNLLESSKKGFKYSGEFYDIKKDLLKLKKLKYYDISANIGKIKRQFTWQESIEIVRDAFFEMDEEFAGILDKMLEDGRIDVFPKIGKEGGAFCASLVNQPTSIMLNHVNDFRSLITFAHEMGHAIHGELSKDLPEIYQGHSTAVAETASTFFEKVVFYKVIKLLDEKEKTIAIHNKLQDNVSSIFRQVACFLYEIDMHESVRRDGFVPSSVMAEKMNKYLSMYLGGSVNLEKDNGYVFIDWAHLRYYFYVYTYAFGHIVSNALYEEYKKDKKYVKNIKKFLSVGNSMSPEEIFKSIGVNISKPDFFKKGIDGFAKDLKEFKKMLKK